MKRSYLLLSAAVTAGLAPLAAQAATVYFDDFTTNSSANYTVVAGKTAATGGTAASDATFAYDYSALGIPAAPHTTDGTTLGLRLRTDNLANTGDGSSVGFVSAATKGLGPFTNAYVVSADVWGNYIGSGTSIATSGSNGSTLAGMGVGTAAGTNGQSPNSNDGVIGVAEHDASSSAYRVYVDNTVRPTPTTSNYFAAGTSTTSSSNSNSYYTSFLPAASAPAAEVTASATQAGTSPAGLISFAWHTFTMTVDTTGVTYAIDGHTITFVPTGNYTFGGSNVSLGAYDTGLTGSTVAINQLLNADFWDNLTVTTLDGTVPEPASLGLIAMGGVSLLTRRRRV